MLRPTAICKSVIKISVNINVSSSTTFLEHTVWVEGLKGERVDGCCPRCAKSFPLNVEALRDNAEVRCWHCHEPSKAYQHLEGAVPGLRREMLRPALNEVHERVRQQLKRHFK